MVAFLDCVRQLGDYIERGHSGGSGHSLKLPYKIEAVTIPANTLIFRSQGLQVAIVRDGRAELVPVVLGHDYGDSVEIVSGLKSSDQVIVNPSDSITSGEQVQAVNTSANLE